jgi:hypothetical protein
MQLRAPKDFWSGVLFVAVGLFTVLYSGASYTLGSAARMGPGYFPRMLGLLLVLLGGILAVRSFRLAGPQVPHWHWKPTVIVLGSVIVFGLVVEKLGLALSTVGLIVAASAASHEFRPRESVVVGLFLAALAVGVFVVGLKLQLPIWPFQR